ncbi:MAG TPA: hypothetical protein VLK65_00705 [Vicinamibacteria bacterium]|nr:hypothetical protein [Vicinamibacteria bacterium]
MTITKQAGQQVPVPETVRGFKEILGGQHHSVPEGIHPSMPFSVGRRETARSRGLTVNSRKTGLDPTANRHGIVDERRHLLASALDGVVEQVALSPASVSFDVRSSD